MKVTTKIVQKSTVIIELDIDEVRWLRDILSLVFGDHQGVYKLFDTLDEVPGVISCCDDDYEGPEVRGFTGLVKFNSRSQSVLAS